MEAPAGRPGRLAGLHRQGRRGPAAHARCGSRSSASTSRSRTRTSPSSRPCATPATTTAAASRSTGSTRRRWATRRSASRSPRPTASSSRAASASAASRARSPRREIARSEGIPFLGVCLGMQLAVADFARHVADMPKANSSEFDPATDFPVVDLLPEQKEVADMGGTMRLGADPVKLHEGTKAREIYGEAVIYERHRHRYEVNNFLRRRLESAGLVVSRHDAGRAAGGDHRAGRPPVLRGLPVPPGVQVAPRAPRAAVPRVRRRRPALRASSGATTRSRRATRSPPSG